MISDYPTKIIIAIAITGVLVFIVGNVVGRLEMAGASIDSFGPHARILESTSVRNEVEKATTVLCNEIIARELKKEAIEAEQEARNVQEGKDAKDPNKRGMRKSTANPVR